MNNVHSLTHGPLVWNESLPPDFAGHRLPGCQLLSASGESGSLCIQQYSSQDYTFRYNVFQQLNDCVLKTSCEAEGFFAQLVLQGNVHQHLNNAGTWILGKNQFAAMGVTTFELVSRYDDQQAFIAVDTFFSNEWVAELSTGVPELSQHPYRPILTSPRWVDAGTLELVHSILRCPYQGQFRRYFLESRLRELLYRFLIQSGPSERKEKSPTSYELLAVEKAQEIISQDISRHTHIPQLSRLVGLNEFRFKVVFKKVYGFGPYEYLVNLRMKKGKELLESGYSVKETAAATGYRPTDFTAAFIHHYGFAPSIIKKNAH